MEITQKAFIESTLNRFGFNSSSDIPTSGVELGPREEGELGGDWRYREAVGSLLWLSTMTRPVISNAVRCCAPLPQPYGGALEGSFEYYGIPSRDQVLDIDFCAELEMGFDCV